MINECTDKLKIQINLQHRPLYLISEIVKMNYLDKGFERIKLKLFGRSNIEYVIENFLLILTTYYKAELINIEQLKEYSLEYPDSFSSIEEYSEDFIHSQDNYLIFIMSASSENAFLANEKYNLLIISVSNNKIKKCYQKFYENDKILQYVIEQFEDENK